MQAELTCSAFALLGAVFVYVALGQINLRGRSHRFYFVTQKNKSHLDGASEGMCKCFTSPFLNYGTTMSRDHTAHLHVMVQQNNAAAASLLGCVESETQFYPIKNGDNTRTQHKNLPHLFFLHLP